MTHRVAPHRRSRLQTCIAPTVIPTVIDCAHSSQFGLSTPIPFFSHQKKAFVQRCLNFIPKTWQLLLSYCAPEPGKYDPSRIEQFRLVSKYVKKSLSY